MASAPPSLANICEQHVGGLLQTISSTVASCDAQAKLLSARKDELLVELGSVSETLEELSGCRQQCLGMRAALEEELRESLAPGAATAILARMEAAGAAAAAAAATAAAEAAHAPAAATQPMTGPERHAQRKAARRAAALPEDAQARDGVLARQVLVRGLKPGRLNEGGVGDVQTGLVGVEAHPAIVDVVQIPAQVVG